MQKFEQSLGKCLEAILVLLLLTIAVTIVSLVVLRYGFNSSITGANEFVTILFVYSTAMGAAVELGRGEHIAISFVTDKFGTRGQSGARLLELTLVAVLNVVIAVYSLGWIRITGDYIMPSTGLPRVAMQASVPIGCTLAAVYCLLRIQSTFRTSETVQAPTQSQDQLP